MKRTALTYRRAGVDIREGERLVERIKPMARSTMRPEVMAGLGSFGSLFRLNTRGMKRPVLVSGTDGVGTKLKVAFRTGRHHTVGIDLVAMCVNDILTLGAEPLFFLDYFASGRLKANTAADVISGIAEGCRQAGAALIGGETAELPGFYAAGEYDLAGFAVGVVDESRIIDGNRIEQGDLVIGLPSNGIHSNGYSLVRKVFFEVKGFGVGRRLRGLQGTLGDELLRPTRVYVKTVLSVLRRHEVKGMAHITGGGITGNLPRILPKGLKAVIDRNSWQPDHVFTLVREYGDVEYDEMFRTFNMGIGYVIVAGPEAARGILRALKRAGEKPVVIGNVQKGRRGVKYI